MKNIGLWVLIGIAVLVIVLGEAAAQYNAQRDYETLTTGTSPTTDQGFWHWFWHGFWLGGAR